MQTVIPQHQQKRILPARWKRVVEIDGAAAKLMQPITSCVTLFAASPRSHQKATMILFRSI